MFYNKEIYHHLHVGSNCTLVGNDTMREDETQVESKVDFDKELSIIVDET